METKEKKILYIGMDYSLNRTSFYQVDLLNTLESLFDVKRYGIGFPGYNKSLSIKDVIEKLNFHPDLILISDTWEIQDMNISGFDPNPSLNLSEVNIPKLFFINKEYKKLDLKLKFIMDNKIDHVKSILKHKCHIWEEETGVKFIWKPFGVSFNRIISNDKKRPYDFGFTGNLHEIWIPYRLQLKKHMFKEKYLNFKRIHSLYHKKRFKDKYSQLNIYWAEWFQRKIWPRSRRVPIGMNYFKFLPKFKTFFNTKSAIGTIGTRFLELMASKTMIICPKDDYDGLIKDNETCIMYKDLDDFDEKLLHYTGNEEDRKKIVDKAYEKSLNYKWEDIVIDLMKKIKFI